MGWPFVLGGGLRVVDRLIGDAPATAVVQPTLEAHGLAVLVPFLLGLAAHGGTDRGTPVERLTDELEAFASKVRADSDRRSGEPDRDRSARNWLEDADFELERDDELGRLSEAVDELASAVRERERRFAERERELQRTNERLTAIIEASPTATVAMDTDGTVEQWNSAAETTFGWNREEVLGEPLPIVPDEREDEFDAFRRRLADGESLSGVETKRRTKDGELIDVRFSAAPIRDDEGGIDGIVRTFEDVTERKEHERRLERTTARLEALFENSPDMIDVLDADGTIVEANRRFCDELGYAESELIGTKIWEYERLFEEDDVLSLLEGLSVGERRKFEDRYERRDGSSFPTEVHLIRLDLTDEDRYLSICRDVSERKEYERDLEETKRRLELALEVTNTGVWEWDLETNEVRWDEILEEFVGLEPGEFDGTLDAFRRRVHPADRDRVQAEIDRAIEDDELYRSEFRLRHEDGGWRWVESRGRLVRDEHGERMVGIRNDVTERMESQRELERTTRLLAQAEETAGVGGWSIDVSGEPPYSAEWTDKLYDIFELPRDAEPPSEDVFEFFHPDDREQHRKSVERAIETGQGWDQELRLITAEGTERWVRTIGEPITDEEGDVVEIIGSVQDVTDRKERERQLRERERELQRYTEYTDDVLDAIDDVFYVLDEEYEFLRWNESLPETTGYTGDEIAAKNALELIPEDEREDVREGLDRIDELAGVPLETTIGTKGGDVIPFEFVAAPLEDPDGNRVIAGIGRDISERVEKERQLSRLIGNIPGLVYRTSHPTEWTAEFISEGVREITGYDPEALERGEISWGDDVIARGKQAITAQIWAAVEDRDPYELVYPIETADGERRWVKEHGRGVYDDGSVEFFEGIVIDITERIEYEQELQRTQQLLEQSQQLAEVGAWEIDVSGSGEPDVRMSDEIYRIHGLSPGEDFDFEDGREYFHPDDWERLREAVADAVERGESYDMEVRLTTPAGERRWARAIGEPVFEGQTDRGLTGSLTGTDGGEVVAVRGSMQNITERKRRETELERTRELLDQAQRIASVGGWELDVTTDPPEMSFTDELYRLHGLSTDADLDLDRIVEQYHPDDRAYMREQFETAVEEGVGYDMEVRLQRTEEDVRWVRALCEPLIDGDEVVALRGSIQDVTAQKERERELGRTTRMLEQAQQLAQVGAWEADVSGPGAPELTISDEVARIHGLSPDIELELDEAIDFYHPEDRSTIRTAVERAIEDGEAYDLELRLVPAGETDRRWVRTIGEPVYQDGEVVKVQGSFQDITDRKERERDLERFETIIQAIGDPVYTLDPSGEFQFVNEAVEPLAGYEPEDLIGEHVTKVISDADLERAQDMVRTLNREDEPYGVFEMGIETAGGDIVETENHMALLPSDDGEFVGTAGVVRDITERKERERELERTTELLEHSEELAGTGGWELDMTSDTLRATLTDGLKRLFEMDDESVPEDRFDLIHPEDRPRLEAALEAITERGEPFDMELRVETVEGTELWVRTIGRPVYEDGEIVRLRGSTQDITDRKERELELERTTELLEQAQRIAGVGGWELDVTTDSYDLMLTPQVQRLLGREQPSRTKRDVKNAIEHYHPDDRSRVLSAVDAAVETGEAYDLEVRMYTYDGDERWVRTIGEPVTEDGDVVAIRGTVQDITDRKEREQELERTTDLLERVQQMASIGGWEVDLRSDPPESTWTDECYRLHGLPRDADPDLELVLESYRPDERERVRREVQRALETETGFDLEAQLQPTDGTVRWVRAMGDPIFADGEMVKYRGSVQDVTDRKRRELALESLHETARGLLNAETEPTVAELVVDTAVELFESDEASAGLYLLDSATNRFEPVATTGGFADRDEGAPSVAVGDSDSALWNTYVTGTQTVVDAEVGDRSALFGDGSGGLLVPIGDHGVFVLAAPPATIDDEGRQLFETLVATTEAALDRLESEASLRERDAELEARNRRLRRQIQITEIIRGIDRSLIGAESRDEIEATVPEQLVEAENVAFAWIGDLDPSGTTLEPRAWAGTAPGYLDSLSLDLEGDSAEPAVRTAKSETPTVVENVVEDLQRESWRSDALSAGFQSVLSVPIAFEEYSYGVLTVYADEQDAFTDLERTVFAELGEGIANAITATKTQEALHAETLVELTLRLEGDDLLSRIASTTDSTVTYEGLGAHSSSETVLFFEVTDAPADDVLAALDDLVSVTEHRLVTESESACLFEATVTGDVVASRLVRHGGSPRSIVATGERTVVTVDVPMTTDVREFVEMLGDYYASVDLQSRRHVQRTMQTRQELVTSLFDELTDRQLEVLRTAYLAGFFEWPRESTGEEIAEMLAVTQPTVNRHLRIGQRRLFEQLFEHEPIPVADETGGT